MVFKKLLKKFDLKLVVAENGVKAVDAYKANKFNIIFMDINMPEMDGVTATQLIRLEEKKYNKPQIPIVALTANTMKHQVEDYIANGINKHLGKPIKRSLLLSELSSMLPAEYSET